MPTGTVVRWINAKGVGFIKPDEEGLPDLLVHHSEVFIGDRKNTFVTLGDGEKVE